MYIRTTKRKNKDGSEIQYFQLAHNFRDPDSGTVKASIIHNFGRVDQLDRADMERLCKSIARICNLEVRDPAKDKKGTTTDGGNDVFLPGVTMGETKALGAVWVVSALWEQLGIGPILRKAAKEAGLGADYEKALLAMTTNRLCTPESKLGVWDRWLKTVHLPSCDNVSLSRMYEAMDFLYERIEMVEQEIFFHTANLLNLEVDIIFYDATNVSFSIDYEDDENQDGLRFRGHAKDGYNNPLVSVALAVTREGLPVRSWVFPGNTPDVQTVEKVRADLRGWKLGRAMFVGDSGMNSEANRSELARGCGTYLLASRVGSVAEIQDDVLSQRGRFRKIAENLRAKEVVVGDGVRKRRYILCLNPEEARRQAHHRRQVLVEIKEELSKHKEKKATAKWAVQLMASGRYGKYLKVGTEDNVVIDQEKIRKAKRMDGKWVLITNDDSISVEDAAKGYKGLLVIEQCFRSLKTTRIKMQPVYHWLPNRIAAHVKICVMALLIQRVAELAVGRPWPRIREDLDRIQTTCFTNKSTHFFRRNNIPEDAALIMKTLGISNPSEVLDIQKNVEKL